MVLATQIVETAFIVVVCLVFLLLVLVALFSLAKWISSKKRGRAVNKIVDFEAVPCTGPDTTRGTVPAASTTAADLGASSITETAKAPILNNFFKEKSED